MDVKNKVDENVVKNVVKEDKPTKPDADEKDTSYRLSSWLWIDDYFIEQTS